MTRAKNCSHLGKKCLMESTLVCHACDNVANRTLSEKNIRDFLVSILDPALANFVFDFDPKRRHKLNAAQLAALDDEVPMSLVTAMKRVGILDNDDRKCWVCDDNASIMAVHCAGPDCKEVAHPDCMHFTCPSKKVLLEIIPNVDFFCDAHKHLKGRQRAIAASTNKDDPLCFYCGKAVDENDLVYCDNDDCMNYHFQCLPGVSLHDDIPHIGGFLDSLKFNCALSVNKHCFPKFVGTADEDVVGMAKGEGEGEGEEEEVEEVTEKKRGAETAGPSSTPAPAAKRGASSRFGVLFQEDPVETTPGTLASTKAKVNHERAGLLDEIKKLPSWDLPRVVSILGEEPTPKACSGYLMVIIEPFFSIVKRSLPSAAAYEAAEFLHPGSNTVLSAEILPYLTRSGEGVADVELNPSEFTALLKATSPQPTSFDAATGMATLAGRAFKVDGSMLHFFNRACTAMALKMDAITVSRRLVEIVGANNPELLLVNRSVEYDANATRNALHKSLMHELYPLVKGHGRMLEFLKGEIAADEAA